MIFNSSTKKFQTKGEAVIVTTKCGHSHILWRTIIISTNDEPQSIDTSYCNFIIFCVNY